MPRAGQEVSLPRQVQEPSERHTATGCGEGVGSATMACRLEREAAVRLRGSCSQPLDLPVCAEGEGDSGAGSAGRVRALFTGETLQGAQETGT